MMNMKLKITVLQFFFIVASLVGLNSCSHHSLKIARPLSKSNSTTPVSTLSFDYVNRLIRIEAGINNEEASFDFILDTGAPTFVTNDVVEQNNLWATEQQTAMDVNGNEQSLWRYNIQSLKIGGQSFKRVKALSNTGVSDMAVLKNRANGGLIGADLMKNAIWKINYGCREITLSTSLDSLNIHDSIKPIKLYLDETGSPWIQAQIGDLPKLDFIVDLGYNGSVLLPEHLLAKPVFNDSLTQQEMLKLSTGFYSEDVQLTYKFIKTFKWGPHVWEDVKASSSGNNTKALLGNAFFENHVLVLDFIHHKLFLLPPDPSCSA
jgi:hypothetical protein